ncbi:DUF1294 domain-containing protein [Parerythrobacter lacustris]|uniref:DUF1294 domain-containing protein n=1 Tax=Parerythrobacter lacustris TaxID=2969984 RepID=A0ABT1XMV4_9SPHN|nr:DUF1294 domain-containing protein [Parerythrobacter lacustris]MCR2832582.1 DUF1294 domain-containing protein [Parerythrobacter lacustris]
MQYLTAEYVTYYLIAVNLITFASFGFDKASAERGDRRTPERDLLFWALIGGTPAAYAARALFRHKIRKEPFSTYLRLLLFGQIALLTFVLVTRLI